MGGDLVQERNKPNIKMLIAPTSPGLILIHPHALWHLGSIYMLARGNNHAFITTMGIDCHCWWCPQSHSPFILHQQSVSYHFNKCSVSSPWQSLTTSHFPSSLLWVLLEVLCMTPAAHIEWPCGETFNQFTHHISEWHNQLFGAFGFFLTMDCQI